MKFKIKKIAIRNYRSITKLDLDNYSEFLITCGANNVGKTNFLRAINLFFESDDKNFSPENDIPYHIYSGTKGGGNKSTIKLTFEEISNGKISELEKVFSENKGEKELHVSGKIDGVKKSHKELSEFLENFHFFFIEASNINLPELIASIVNDEILPIGLDRRRGKKQQQSLKTLDEFIEQSQVAVKRMEDDMTKILLTFLQNVDYIDTNDWKLRIIFPEYSYLREAISSMITFTLHDSNDRQLDAKGSGIQRMILLSLINYIKTKSKKEVIWAIDEPEAFLQPGLQKGLFKELKEISKSNQIIIATHSHFFVNIADLQNTYLLRGTKELKEYARRPGVHYYKLNTEKLEGSENDITQAIKEHLGIEKNDSWEIQPFNVVVEGLEDKDYLTRALRLCNVDIPNIIPGYGVDKYSGLFIWMDEYCSELSFRPLVRAVFDRDGNGRTKFQSFQSKKYKNFDLEVMYINRYDGATFNEIELEDFMIPEIIYPALNRFLRKKGYKSIKQSDLKKRELAAYANMPTLQFISDIIKMNNEDKAVLDFNNQGLKYVISEYTTREMDNKDNWNTDFAKYPEVIRLLKRIGCK
ncbi:MAG: AAA family ATPase [Marinoscillum sp.]